MATVVFGRSSGTGSCLLLLVCWFFRFEFLFLFPFVRRFFLYIRMRRRWAGLVVVPPPRISDTRIAVAPTFYHSLVMCFWGHYLRCRIETKDGLFGFRTPTNYSYLHLKFLRTLNALPPLSFSSFLSSHRIHLTLTLFLSLSWSIVHIRIHCCAFSTHFIFNYALISILTLTLFAFCVVIF